MGISQQMTSITPKFCENVVAVVLFYTTSAITTKAIFMDYAGDLTQHEYKELISKLKERKLSHLVFSLHYPFGLE